MPEIKDPIEKSSNELVNIPPSEISDPIKPATFPISNPNLLVVDCIIIERSGALNIEPTIIKEIGRVA